MSEELKEIQKQKVIVVWKELMCNGEWDMFAESEEEFEAQMWNDSQNNPDFEKNMKIVSRIYADTYTEGINLANKMIQK